MAKLINDWQTTDYPAVNMVATCVSHFRKLLRPVKTIYLSPMMYGQFELWVSKQMDEEQFVETRAIGFQFDGVDVKRKSALLVGDIDYEFYNQTELQA